MITTSYKTGMAFTIDIPMEAIEDALPCMLDSIHTTCELVVFWRKESEK